MNQEQIKKDLDASLASDQFIQNNVSSEGIEVLKDYKTALNADFYSHSYELYKEVILTPLQYSGPKGVLLKAAELLDKAYTSIFDAIGAGKELQAKIDKVVKGDKQLTDEAKVDTYRYQLLLYVRSINASISEITTINKIVNDSLAELAEKGEEPQKFDELDWNQIKIDSVHTRMEELATQIQEQGGLDSQTMQNLTPANKAMIENIMKERANKPKIHKPPKAFQTK
jgi:hypothetical protein